jgi:predicted metalloprotease with PDZ domain
MDAESQGRRDLPFLERRNPSASLRLCVGTILLFLLGSPSAFAQAPVVYRVTIPEPQHHWMQVEVVFPDLPAGPAHVLVSRSSPGRYAIHEFVKNVYDVQIDDGAGRTLTAERPNVSEWEVAGHSGLVRVRYKVFGDSTDGTYLGIDTSHAHINIPAALMWARGLENRPARITFQPPPGASWKVATQLHATDDSYTFTAPNLYYLVDSPTEVSGFALRSFTAGQSFRIALHHDGSDRDADRLAADVERIVKEESAVFGELPAYENGYTFIVDLLPYAAFDGMEHRNSTIVTFPGALRVPDQRMAVLSTAAHEFFHSWNVERIRPKSLEPFKLDDANMAGELWFAEGFTSYYEALILARTGLFAAGDFASAVGTALETVINSPARRYRSAEDMSRLAPVTDGAVWRDRTNWDNTYISYYTWGTAIGLGLDLSLRARSDNKVILDDFMRALWRRHGEPRAPAEGFVAEPYTIQDLKDRLAEVSGDREFADQFFARYIQGREVVDYQRLLAQAGFVLRKRNTGRAWIGPLSLRSIRSATVVVEPTLEGTPVYDAGVDRDDEILSIDGETVGSPERLDEIVRRHKPGDKLRAVVRRAGFSEQITIAVGEDPGLELVPAETSGRALSAAERGFRDAWLKSRVAP